MSTRSLIGIQRPDGTITGVYCHFDGYPDTVGKILREHYSDPAKVEQLVALGSLSSLGPRLAPKPDEAHSFGRPAKDVTVAYHRDRGEPKQRNFEYRDFDRVVLDGLDYGYVLIPEGWVYRGRSGAWKPLMENSK